VTRKDVALAKKMEAFARALDHGESRQ